MSNTAAYYPNNTNFQRILSAVSSNNFKNAINNQSNVADFDNFTAWVGANNVVLLRLYNATNYNITTTNMKFDGTYQEISMASNNSLNYVGSLNTKTNQALYGWNSSQNAYNSLNGVNYNWTEFEILPPTYVGMQAMPSFIVTSTFEDVNVDNVQNKAFRLDYNQSFTNIGHIEGITDGSHFVNITFSQVAGGFLIRDTLNMYNMFNSNEDFYIDENFDIYIRNRLLTYNTKYLLTADTFTDSTFTTQTGNYELNYYTVTLNAVISGGIITNFGSGDYSIQNSINDTIDFYTDDSLVNSEIDSFFSGDTNSIVSNLNFPNLENNYFVVIYNVVAGISDTLQMSGDPYFDISLHGETPKRIYASDFTTPPSLLKTFISMSLIFGTLYVLYMQLSGFIMLINTGHVKDAINQIDDVSGNTLYKM